MSLRLDGEETGQRETWPHQSLKWTRRLSAVHACSQHSSVQTVLVQTCITERVAVGCSCNRPAILSDNSLTVAPREQNIFHHRPHIADDVRDYKHCVNRGSEGPECLHAGRERCPHQQLAYSSREAKWWFPVGTNEAQVTVPCFLGLLYGAQQPCGGSVAERYRIRMPADPRWQRPVNTL